MHMAEIWDIFNSLKVKKTSSILEASKFWVINILSDQILHALKTNLA